VSEHEAWWLTAGAGLALWTVGSALRHLAKGLNRIYELEERRSLVERLVSSTLLALAAIVLLGAALAIGRFGSAIIGQEGAGGVAGVALAVERSLLTGILLLGVVALLLRYAPAERRPVHWVSIGSLIVVGGWAVWSAAFAWYASSIADY